MAGTTIIDYFTFKTFWRLAEHDDNKAFALTPLMAKYSAFVKTGAMILFITGIGMLLMAKGIWWQQLWFKIKMALVMSLVLNGIFIGNKQGLRLRNMAHGDVADFVHTAANIRANLNRFYIVQLLIFFAIILVSVIKFNK